MGPAEIGKLRWEQKSFIHHQGFSGKRTQRAILSIDIHLISNGGQFDAGPIFPFCPPGGVSSVLLFKEVACHPPANPRYGYSFFVSFDQSAVSEIVASLLPRSSDTNTHSCRDVSGARGGHLPPGGGGEGSRVHHLLRPQRC